MFPQSVDRFGRRPSVERIRIEGESARGQGGRHIQAGDYPTRNGPDVSDTTT